LTILEPTYSVDSNKWTVLLNYYISSKYSNALVCAKTFKLHDKFFYSFAIKGKKISKAFMVSSIFPKKFIKKEEKKEPNSTMIPQIVFFFVRFLGELKTP
jgi:hypothetical protein